MELLNVRKNQGMLANQIDDSWNTSAGPVNRLNCFVGKDLFRTAGDQQTLRDIVRCLLSGDRVRPCPKRDALPKLAYLRSAQLLFQFGLT